MQGIQTVMNALGTLTDAAGVSLTERVTFATLNVFGRNLNGIQKVTDRTGRDHFGNHSVMVMIGKNVKAGVIGGVVAATNGAYSAGDIDSATGAQVTGGDVSADQEPGRRRAHAGRGARHPRRRRGRRLHGGRGRQGRHRRAREPAVVISGRRFDPPARGRPARRKPLDCAGWVAGRQSSRRWP